MDVSQVRERHYTKTEGLVIRTAADEGADTRARPEPASLERLLSTRPATPSLVPSADGRIARMLLTVPAYATSSEPLAAVYRDLLARLPHDTALVVLTHESAKAVVERWLGEAARGTRARDDVLTAPDHLNFSVWAEDGYAVVHDGGLQRTLFVEPYSFPRYGDSLIADLVAGGTDLESTQAPLYFQGGNVLVGDDFFLLGADYPANTLSYVGPVLTPEPGESAEALVHRLYREYLDPGRRLRYVGSGVPVPAQQSRPFTLGGERWTEYLYLGNRPGTVQPMFHIDMFLTLAGRGADGRYRVLVGDPAAAADVLGHDLLPHAMAEVFDDIAAVLDRDGFHVLRNPLPLAYVDDPLARERFWYFATSNNALVQLARGPGEGADAVYLPTYGHGAWPELAATDEANAQIWAGLGVEPVMLGDFHPFASNLGAAHCIKKYLARA